MPRHPVDDYKFLSRYLDGEASAAEVRRLEEHVDYCSRCHTRIEEHKQLDAQLRRLGDQRHTVPYRLEARIQDSIEARRNRLLPWCVSSISRLLPPTLGTVAAALIVSLVTVVGPGQSHTVNSFHAPARQRAQWSLSTAAEKQHQVVVSHVLVATPSSPGDRQSTSTGRPGAAPATRQPF